jgi:hypothetical protein
MALQLAFHASDVARDQLISQFGNDGPFSPRVTKAAAA